MFELKYESSLFLRIVTVFIGTFIAGLGIQVIVTADFGCDSVSTLILGLLNHTDLSFGRVSQIISLIFLVISFCYQKKMLGIGSIINGFFLGESIHLLQPFVSEIKVIESSMLASFAGFVLLAFGTSIYLKADLGAGPLEGMMLSVCDLFKLDLKRGRILLDFLLVSLGVMLGSSLNWGTMIGVFLLGPIISFFNKLLPDKQVNSGCKVLRD